MDIVDCRVAPMGTAVYSFISQFPFSVSPAQMGQTPCNSVLLRVTHRCISLQGSRSSRCQPGSGERLEEHREAGDCRAGGGLPTLWAVLQHSRSCVCVCA